MILHKCERCGYTTNRGNDYKKHLNRQLRCKIKNPHGNTKRPKKSTWCAICKVDLYRCDALATHNKSAHPDKKIVIPYVNSANKL
jgi:uncharacterized C2H2 Zn-finger protein